MILSHPTPVEHGHVWSEFCASSIMRHVGRLSTTLIDGPLSASAISLVFCQRIGSRDEMTAESLDMKAREYIGQFTAIFVLDAEQVLSGVFVATGKTFGILTAYHVARQIEFSDFCVLLLAPRQLAQLKFKEIVIGPLSSDRDKQCEGPDLTFLHCTDSELLFHIQQHKKFFDLDAVNPSSFLLPLTACNWHVAGSPQSTLDKTLNDSVRLLDDAVIQAKMLRHFHRGKFDYLELEVSAGEGNCPFVYGGMSGGGVWISRVDAITDPNDPILLCHLAGIQFCENEELFESGRRGLTTHGFDSIYKNAITKLKTVRP